MAAQKAGLDLSRLRTALDNLAAADLVALDAQGEVAGLYPLSAAPIRHQVHVAGGPVLHAMCAIDGLGIPAMLGMAATIASTDPTTGQSIRVRLDADGGHVPDPASAVVLLGPCRRRSPASACCAVIDFYADPAGAQQALDRPGMHGAVLSISETHDLGVALFAALPAR